MEDLISTGVLSNQKASDSDDERKLPSWMLPNQLSSMSNINLEENSSKDATQDCSLVSDGNNNISPVKNYVSLILST